MAFTLRGRLETRLAVALLPFLVAAGLAGALEDWWPLRLVGLMLAAGLVLDLAYHPLLRYQPAWAAVPLGLLELAATMALVRLLGVEAPLVGALAFYAGAWLWAQVVVHVLLPLAHLTYGDDGGELGRGGAALAAAAPVALLGVLGAGWLSLPPTVHLAAGVHEGPLVVDRERRIVGEPGAVVRGGIVVTADKVQVRNVTVFGGDIGIEVRESVGVVLDGVTVAGATHDGISARMSSVRISDCVVEMPRVGATQGIDISFASSLPPSRVERCHVRGGIEGIVTHLAHVEIRDNRVSGTGRHGIAVTEMSMGAVVDNAVSGGTGTGIFCGDFSHCDIRGNVVGPTRADPDGNRTLGGHAVVAHYGAVATVADNTLAGGTASFIGARIDHR